MKLIGLHGHAGVGKDTFAEQFHFYNFRQFAFADPVKAAAAEAFGIPIEYFHDTKKKEIRIPYWDLSPREMAQIVGTECFRNNFGQDVWIRRMEFNFIKHYTSSKYVRAVISDVRFPNEIDFILNKGGIIVHLTREGRNGTVGISGHSSEQKIDFTDSKFIKGVNYEHITNDSNIEMLRTKAKSFIYTHNLDM